MSEILTPAQQAKAVLLATDFSYYAPRCLKIKTKAGEIVPFVMNRAQLRLHERVERQRSTTGKVRVLNLKGRQQGISTYWEGRFYWRTSLTRGKRAYILTHLDEATENLFDMTKRFNDNCPEQMRPHTKNDSAKALTFDRLDSEFSVATAGSKNTGRSGTGQFFHGSEVAFWANAADHMAGIGQTIPNEPGTEIALESTGNGIGNLFHSMWQDAVRGIGDYIPVFVPWFWQPEYQRSTPIAWQPDQFDGYEYGELYGLTREQLYWREQKIITDFRSESSYFDQEYPATAELAFRRQAGATLFKLATIERAMQRTDLEPVGPKIMGVDPAESEDGDDTVFILRQGRVVTGYKRFHGRNTMQIVALAAHAAEEWAPDFINVDAGGLGSGVADRLAELGHPITRILFGERADEKDLYGLRRDEMWGEMAEWFKEDVQLPPASTNPLSDRHALDGDALKADLCGPLKEEDSSLRFRLESKKAMKKRGLKSPDGGDALALTFAIPAVAVAKRPSRAEPTNWRVV